MAERPTPSPAAPADAAALPAGYRIHEYQIERKLGGGGFGITYLARDINLDLTVAIKEYFPSDQVTRAANHAVQVRGNTDSQNLYQWGLERFLDEARALATFRHRNIVRVLRYFRENDTAYIVMECESDDPLKRCVPQIAPLSQSTLLGIVYPVLDGLEAVHKTGFLHRDIKPDNIYVRGDGTPVLLDFGAARRVSTDRDMTNIVSPGFAPFEQYHSHGHQGPWTDIYSLGAVMYWMTTGTKPTESAARVKVDNMVPASTAAKASVFGIAMLQAIDWALQPDEGKRPQTIAEFRAAIRGSEGTDTRTVDIDVLSEMQAPVAAAGTAPTLPPGPNSASQLVDASRKNLLCTIMFLDLVGYSARSINEQVILKKIFHDLVAKAVKSVPEQSRIAIDTGDGAAICFLGDPEEALSSALLLRDLLGQKLGTQIGVRIGLHMGPVRIVSDINGRVNVVGDGINVAQRIMDFAQSNQVLVSRSYYDVISRITDDMAQRFEYLGQQQDKHNRLHELYSVGAPPADGKTGLPTRTMPTGVVQPLVAQEVAQLENELAKHIGPLARVLVRKAQPLARSLAELREALAPSIQEPKAREAFLAGPGNHSRPSGSRPSGSQPNVSRPAVSQPMPTSQPGPRAGASQLATPFAMDGRTVPPQSFARSQPASQLTGRMGDSTRPAEFTASDVLLLEKHLSQHVGPMAKVMIRKTLARGGSYKDVLEGLAGNIDAPDDRSKFLAAIRRAIPNR